MFQKKAPPVALEYKMVAIYNIEGLQEEARTKAELWNVANPLKIGTMNVKFIKNKVIITIYDDLGKKFAETVLNKYPSSRIISAIDSSRYFILQTIKPKGVLGIKTEYLNIGIGFSERNESLSFVESLNHFYEQKISRKSTSFWNCLSSPMFARDKSYNKPLATQSLNLDAPKYNGLFMNTSNSHLPLVEHENVQADYDIDRPKCNLDFLSQEDFENDISSHKLFNNRSSRKLKCLTSQFFVEL
ncbi:hypothetical protein RF11_11893 [Thelohanellus kitauei]|uniref:NECAP PHear domain-containing protein n=1 Tax=Thelohanellus kitauei TaxID=669202 RepID=A0A0C2N6H0_THEKT|nr:hypothetical protein RF11_11893 [Thelohanellus kitauei]